MTNAIAIYELIHRWDLLDGIEDNKYFDCLEPDGNRPARIIGFVIPSWFRQVSEVRYGDIDKDGDANIAIKLSGGAIYVFHNSNW